jgi:hypothetical protein
MYAAPDVDEVVAVAKELGIIWARRKSSSTGSTSWNS